MYFLRLVLFGGSRTGKLFAIWRQRTGKLFAISRTGRNQLRLEQICVLGLERVVKKILEWQFQSDFINVLRLTIQELNTENSYAYEDLGPYQLGGEVCSIGKPR